MNRRFQMVIFYTKIFKILLQIGCDVVCFSRWWFHRFQHFFTKYIDFCNIILKRKYNVDGVRAVVWRDAFKGSKAITLVASVDYVSSSADDLIRCWEWTRVMIGRLAQQTIWFAVEKDNEVIFWNMIRGKLNRTHNPHNSKNTELW